MKKVLLLPFKLGYEASKLELCKMMSLELEADVQVPTALSSENFTKI